MFLRPELVNLWGSRQRVLKFLIWAQKGSFANIIANGNKPIPRFYCWTRNNKIFKSTVPRSYITRSYSMTLLYVDDIYLKTLEVFSDWRSNVQARWVQVPRIKQRGLYMSVELTKEEGLKERPSLCWRSFKVWLLIYHLISSGSHTKRLNINYIRSRSQRTAVLEFWDEH